MSQDTVSATNMKTYAEQQGQKQTNWLLELKPGLGYEKLQDLNNLAGSWPTCACGNMCSTLPRYKEEGDDYYEGQPKNKVIASLGIDFFQTIEDAGMMAGDDAYDQERVDIVVEEARQIFLQIEGEVKKVINKQRADRKRRALKNKSKSKK